MLARSGTAMFEQPSGALTVRWLPEQPASPTPGSRAARHRRPPQSRRRWWWGRRRTAGEAAVAHLQADHPSWCVESAGQQYRAVPVDQPAGLLQVVHAATATLLHEAIRVAEAAANATVREV